MSELRKATEKLKKQQHLQKLQRCRDDFWEFYGYVMEDAEGKPVRREPFNLKWHQHIDNHIKKYHCGILSPPTFGKTVFGQGYNLWRLGRNPNLRCCWISSKEEIAKTRIAPIREAIERNARLHEVFPELKQGPKWGAKEFIVDRGALVSDPSVVAHGLDSKVSGARWDILFLDDPVDIEDMRQEQTRKDHIHSWSMVIKERLAEHGRAILLIMFRWHEEDLVSMLLKDPEWKIIVQGIEGEVEQIGAPPKHIYDEREKFKAVCTDDSDKMPLPSWSKGASILNEKRTNPLLYAHKYQHKTFGSLNRTFDEDCLKIALVFKDPENQRRALPQFWRELAFQESWPRFIASDFSSKKRAGSVIVVGGYNPKAKQKVLLNIDVGRWGAGYEMCQRLIDTHHEWKSSGIYVEDMGLQDSMIEWADNLFHGAYPFYSVTSAERNDPETGVPSLAVEFRTGQWFIPMRQVLAQEMSGSYDIGDPWCRLLTELRNYPNGTDDCVMALWMLHKIFKMNHMTSPLRLPEAGDGQSPRQKLIFGGSSTRIFTGRGTGISMFPGPKGGRYF